MTTTDAVGYPAFKACIEYAQKNDCHLIIFDNLNPIVDDLESFDW